MTALSDLCAVTFSAPSAPAAVSPVPASAAVPAVALQAAAHSSDGMPPRGLEALTPCPAALAEVLEAVGSAFEGAPRRTADAPPGTMRPVQSPAAEAPVVAGHASAPSAPLTSPSPLPAADAQTAPATEPAAQPVRVPSSAAGDALPSAPGLAVTEGEMPARPTPAAEGAPAKAVTAEHSAAPAERKRPGAVSDADELPLPRPAERLPREVPPAAAPMAAAESVPQQAGPVQTAAVPDAAARVTAMLRAAADAVAASVQVSPDLARTGTGEIRVRLRPDVLDGSSVRFEASGGDLKITLYPATQAAAAVLEAHLERFRTHLAERVANWRINVGVAAWDPHPHMKSGTGRTERDE